MSVFVRAVQVIILGVTICGASTFADERSSALSLAVEADSGDTAGAQVAVKNTSDQVAFENKWDDRALPLLAPITASLTSRDQEPTTVDPESIWSWAAMAMLGGSSAKWADLQSRIRADKRRWRGAVRAIARVLRRRGDFCRSLKMDGNAKAARCWARSIARST